jgi:hypothetical protein
LVSKGAGMAASLRTKAGIRETVDLPWAKRFLDGMKEDVPALWETVKSTAGSAAAKAATIQDPKTFDSALRPQMDRIEHSIAAAAPKVQVPNQPAAPPGGPSAGIPPDLMARFQQMNPGIAAPQAGAPQMIDTTEAFTKWKAAASKAIGSYDRTNPGASFQFRQEARAWEQAIEQAAPPHLVDVWKAARAEFGRALRYREIGQQALATAEPTAAGTPFNTQGVVAHIYSDPQRYAPSRIPGFHQNFFRGVEQGAQPVINDPGLYARMFMPGPAHIKANIPTPKSVTLPGQTGGAPVTSDVLSGLTKGGIMGLGNLTANPSPQASTVQSLSAGGPFAPSQR